MRMGVARSVVYKFGCDTLVQFYGSWNNFQKVETYVRASFVQPSY